MHRHHPHQGPFKNYFAQRLAPLKDRINKEETKNPDACITIRLLSLLPQEKIIMKGCPNDLLIKMESCFTPEDLEYLNKLLNDKNQQQNN